MIRLNRRGGSGGDTPNVNRRRMLMRLGLGATVIYASPMLLRLSEARASGGSGGSGRRGRRGRRGSDGSRGGSR